MYTKPLGASSIDQGGPLAAYEGPWGTLADYVYSAEVTTMKIAKLATRVLIGGLFVGHGTQKLKGWFGGPGIDGLSSGMEAMGMHPPRRNAYAAGISETAGGALLAAGLLTPLASAAIAGTMTVAVVKAHLANGPWVTSGGWEYNAVLIAAVLAIAEDGPGEVSLDHLLGIEKSGPAYGLLAAALGGAAAYGALAAAKAATPPVTAVGD